MERKRFSSPKRAALLVGAGLMAVLLVLAGCGGDSVKSGENSIIEFKIGESRGVISGDEILVRWNPPTDVPEPEEPAEEGEEPEEPVNVEITALKPEIRVSGGASVYPNQDDPRDFSTPVSYTVVAENGASRNYLVRVDLGEVPESITVTKLPAKITYEPGDELETTGLEVTGLYADGTKKTVAAADLIVSGYQPTLTGVQELLVSVKNGDATASFPITVEKQSKKNSIIQFKIGNSYGEIDGQNITVLWTAPPVGEPVEGEAPADNTVITALKPEIIVSEGATVDPASEAVQDFSAPVTYTVTAENGAVNAYQVTVEVPAEPMLEVLRVTRYPNKLTYLWGEPQVLDGLEVTGFYSDDTSRVEGDVTVSGYQPKVIGTQTLLVSKDGITTTFPVVVNAVENTATADIRIYLAGGDLVDGKTVEVFGIPAGGLKLQVRNGDNDGEATTTSRWAILSVSGFDTTGANSINWYDDTGAPISGYTDKNIIVLDAWDYTIRKGSSAEDTADLGKHFITFKGIRNGITYTQKIEFTVEI